MNRFIGLGRLTRNVESKVTGGEKSITIANFSIAITRDYKKDGEPDADFFNCVAFGKTAEFIQEYFSKGQQICVEGKIKNSTYENKEGVKKNKSEVLVDRGYFAGSSKNNETNQDTNSKEDDVPFV